MISGVGAGNWADVTSVTVNLPAPGDIFVASSFTGRPGAANDRGYWRLVDEDGNQIGQAFETLLVNAGQPSSFALFAIANNLTATGNRTFTLQHTNGANPMTTSNVSLVAVALSLPDGRRFEAYQATNPTEVGDKGNDSTMQTVASSGFTLAETSDVLVMAQFRASTTGGMQVSFRVEVDGSVSEWGRFSTASSSGDRGGTNSGLFEDHGAGAQTSQLTLYGVSGTGQQATVPAYGSNLVTILLNTAARTGGEGDIDLYRATLHTWDNRTILDTCRARTIGEARAAFETRHVGAHIGGITHIRNARARGYRLLGVARPRVQRQDTCWAQNPAQARDIIGERFPDGVVNHMGYYPSNARAVTWYGVTQRPDLSDCLVAASPKEAFAAFSQRFGQAHIVHVSQISTENTYHTYEGTLDPEDITVLQRAASAEQAASAALSVQPRYRLRRVTPHPATDGVTSYGARVHTDDGRSLWETCSARTVPEAQKILRNRYGAGSSVAVEELDLGDGYVLFEASVSSAGQQSFTDATFAKTAAGRRASSGALSAVPGR